MIPPAKRGGRRREVDEREVVNGIMYVLSTGCQWRYVPKDFPSKSTLHSYFCRWNYDGTLERIHHTLYVKCREQLEREPSATACVIDSQSVKSAEKDPMGRPTRPGVTPCPNQLQRDPTLQPLAPIDHPLTHAAVPNVGRAPSPS
jgi:transposase